MQQHPDVKPLQFHLRYWAAIGLNLLVWVFFPVLGYISFILISAFHFGESQFSHYKLPKSLFKVVFQFLWGLSILAGMTFFNLGEIQVHMASNSSFMVFSGINNSIGPLVLIVLGLVGVLAGLVYLLLSRQLQAKEFAVELGLFVLVHLALYLFPLIVGFTLYFITLHSFKVLREEFQFMQRESMADNLASFVKVLAPFSLMSILGVLGLFFLAQTNLFPQSFAYAFVILISCITVPHAYVMHKFYGAGGA